jgi:DNA-binding NtrC family response regulator
MNKQNPTVFVVDDDASIRDSLEDLIGSAGFNVRTFASAHEFLTHQYPDAPACLILDVQLPGLSGLDLQEELAKLNIQIPIIFVSGYGDIPMTVRAMKAGAIEFLTKPFRDEDLLNAVEQAINSARQIEQLKNIPVEKEHNLEDEGRNATRFSEIVGKSAALRQVLRDVETVAATDSTVLINGETGTGKELIARAIHHLSPRRSNVFVKLNCAAIPTGLLESELFGHEKGAFTGAIAQRIGRFELANHGTIFLDEIGDIPLELQPKLLRVLQEREFERLGSTRTLQTDARLIAATNANLAARVDEKRFRSDLYYRLNVFPVMIPPLRERREDIPLLVHHFVQKYAQRMSKRIDTIPTTAMTAMLDYHWPGNVRELENFIERSVILSSDSALEPPLAELEQQRLASPLPDLDYKSIKLREAQRDHILRTLRDTKWRIGGREGAAARLGVKRTTLQSLVKRLGIDRPD